jgi:hypothetical protein
VKHPLIKLATIVAMAFALNGCREDAIIKSSLTPAVDNIHTFGIGADFNNGTDTITMLTSTVMQDSLITSKRGLGVAIYHALGYMIDPFAGKTTAGIYAQFVPTATGVKLSSNPDSLVLVLPYSGFTWGDTTITTTHTVKVYAINEGFSKDSTFYNYSSRGTDATVIGTATVSTGRTGMGNIQDSVATGVNKKNRAPHLRIKLTDPGFISKFKVLLEADSILGYTLWPTQQPRLRVLCRTSASMVALISTALPQYLLT